MSEDRAGRRERADTPRRRVRATHVLVRMVRMVRAMCAQRSCDFLICTRLPCILYVLGCLKTLYRPGLNSQPNLTQSYTDFLSMCDQRLIPCTACRFVDARSCQRREPTVSAPRTDGFSADSSCIPPYSSRIPPYSTIFQPYSTIFYHIPAVFHHNPPYSSRIPPYSSRIPAVFHHIPDVFHHIPQYSSPNPNPNNPKKGRQ